MGNQRHQRAVARQDGGSGEGQAGILHSPEGKAGRQYDNVILLPAVGPVQFFGGGDHPLGIGKFEGRLRQHRRFGKNPAARPQGAVFDLSHRQRHQVGRNRLIHGEGIYPGAVIAGNVAGAHHRRQRRFGLHRGAIGKTDAGTILAGHPGAGEIGLRLGKEKGMLLAGGLSRGEPLQCRRFRRGMIGNAHRAGLRADGDHQRLAHKRLRLAQGESCCLRIAVQGHPLDGQIPAVEV